MNDDIEPYGYYPDPVEDRAVAYDELVASVEEGKFVAVIDIPGRDAVYFAEFPLTVEGSPLIAADDEVRELVTTRCMYALGRRVEEALKG